MIVFALFFIVGIASMMLASWLLIWSLNTLFGLQIVFSFKTFLATLVLLGVARGVSTGFTWLVALANGSKKESSK